MLLKTFGVDSVQCLGTRAEPHLDSIFHLNKTTLTLLEIKKTNKHVFTSLFLAATAAAGTFCLFCSVFIITASVGITSG